MWGMIEAVSAAVLAGGRSRRLPQGKAWATLADGRPFVQRVVDVLAGIADELFIIANDSRFGSLGVPVFADDYPDGGPLGGIATALRRASTERVLVAACDMPFMSAAVWRFLVERADPDCDAVVPVIAGRWQVLHAMYTHAALPTLSAALRSGDLTLETAVRRLRVRLVAEEDVRAVDPRLRSFTNVNTADDLLRARSADTAGPGGCCPRAPSGR